MAGGGRLLSRNFGWEGRYKRNLDKHVKLGLKVKW